MTAKPGKQGKPPATPPDEVRAVTSSMFGRGMAVARLSVNAGAKAAGYAIGSLFVAKEDAPARRQRFLEEQIAAIVEEVGRLKGSLMKVGQFVSMYGDYFVPPKFNKILKHLQADSPPVAWPEMAAALRRELGDERLARLTLEPKPLAAASLGQVYMAQATSRPEPLCVKIQYPDIDKAIDSDLATLKVLFGILRRGSHGDRYDAVLAEFREVLTRELDYELERQSLELFRTALAADRRYRLPEAVAEFCSGKVLTTTFMTGCAPDDPSVLALPQSRRNALGTALLELYFREIFELGCVQTDPHFGNYKIQVGAQAGEDRLVLLDFGSTRRFPEEFVRLYADYVEGAYLQDRDRVLGAAQSMGLLLPDDPESARSELFELACLFMEPLRYAEKSTAEQLRAADRLEDLPQLIAAKTRRFIDRLGLRPPPREIVLLDRKLMGIFIFLATLRSLVAGPEIIEKYVVGRGRR